MYINGLIGLASYVEDIGGSGKLRRRLGYKNGRFYYKIETEIADTLMGGTIVASAFLILSAEQARELYDRLPWKEHYEAEAIFAIENIPATKPQDTPATTQRNWIPLIIWIAGVAWVVGVVCGHLMR
jgi:hypothetical protein